MKFFVITHMTADFGASYCVREHRIEQGIRTAAQVPLAVTGTLEEARGAVEQASPSCVRLGPEEWDDPVIVETWGQAGSIEMLRIANEALKTGAFL